MPFSFEDSWLSCDGASGCPCPNHLGPNWSMPLAFPDDIDNHPSLRHVASGNECPTSDDADVINRSIPVLQSQLQATEDASQKLMRLQNALRVELDKVEREIGRLREHHGTLTRALDRRSKIMAPIRRLPTEILTDILRKTTLLPSPRGYGSTKRVEADIELESLELVCGQWRRVVLQSPTLWSYMCINAHNSHFRTVNSCGAWSLIRRIERSAHTELIVEIYSLWAHRDERLVIPPLLMTLLVQICSRIRSLKLNLPPSKMLGLSPLRESFDSLRYLSVGDHGQNLSQMTLFDKAAKLVAYDSTQEHGNRLGIPWTQIIRYSACGSAHIHTALHDLKAASNLQDGTFSLKSGSQAPLRVGLDPIACHHLTYLTVYVPPTACVVKNEHPLRRLFEQCSFPALDQLYVSTCGVNHRPDTTDTFHALLLCLQRSRSPLSVLSYDHGPVAPADVDAFFRTVPTICHVKFTRIWSGLNDTVLQSLHVQPGQVTIVAPCLKSLLFEAEFEFDATRFAAMVKSRWDVAPLHSIDLHWHVVTDERSWEDYVDPRVEVKRGRWKLEGAILEDELNGYAERGMNLAICTQECDVLFKSWIRYI